MNISGWRSWTLFTLSIGITKVTTSCENRKKYSWPKIRALNFLLFLVDIFFTVVKVFQKLSTFQVIFQFYFDIFLTKICFFRVETWLLNSLTDWVRSRCTDISLFLLDIFPVKNWKGWRMSHLLYPVQSARNKRCNCFPCKFDLMNRTSKIPRDHVGLLVHPPGRRWP